MKKINVLIPICLPLLALSACQGITMPKFFSQESLDNAQVPSIPRPEGKTFLLHGTYSILNGYEGVVYGDLNHDAYDSYVRLVYQYINGLNFKYIYTLKHYGTDYVEFIYKAASTLDDFYHSQCEAYLFAFSNEDISTYGDYSYINGTTLLALQYEEKGVPARVGNLNIVFKSTYSISVSSHYMVDYPG